MAESGDSIQIYLKQIGEIPLLSLEEEQALARRLKKGDEEARRILIRSNLRLVVTIAKRYMNIGLSFQDLIEEGNLGLMKAVDKYDLAKGSKVSTYASWWIKQSMMRALANQAKMIRIPVYMVEKITSVNKASEILFKRMGRTPTPHEIAEYLGMDPDKVLDLQSMSKKPESLHETIGEDGVSELIDVISDQGSSRPNRAIAEHLIQDNIMELLSKMDEREAKIVAWRFGLFGDPPKTLEDIGQKLGITRERVRQINEAAIKKMREILKDKKLEYKDFNEE
jgi:RNA polymerase primary sigma factor